MRTLSYGMHVESCTIVQLCSQLSTALYDPLGVANHDVTQGRVLLRIEGARTINRPLITMHD